MIWLAGFLTGAAWSIVNFLLILGIFRNIFLHANKYRLLFALLIKFPGLYIIGYLILKSNIFPFYSLVLGVSIGLILMRLVYVCRNRVKTT